MIIASAIISLGTMLLLTRFVANHGPARLVQIGLFCSSVLLLIFWRVVMISPGAAAIGLYFLLAITGSVLVSWFWAMVTERFDPRTAKRKIGPIVTAGSCGGIAGGILAERMGAMLPISMIFPMLAALHAIAAIFTRRIGDSRDGVAHEAIEPASLEGQDALTMVLRRPYLRSLAALVTGVAVSAVLLDYVLKARAQATLPNSNDLLRFFAVFYMGISIVTLVAQALFTRRLLQKWGLANTAASLPAVTAVASFVAAVVPGLGTISMARGIEMTLRSSIFRSSYELFYTPISTRLKRTAKTLVDVGFDRAGEGIGAIAIHAILVFATGIAEPALLALAILMSLGCLLLAPRLHRGYVAALEGSLLRRDSSLDPETIEDETTRSVFLRTISSREMRSITPSGIRSAVAIEAPHALPPDPVVAKVLELRSGDSIRVRRLLASSERWDPALIPHLIRLLAWDEVSSEAARALASGVDKWAGQLIDALLDPEEEFSIRRRIPRILARSDSERAATGLHQGLHDPRFEVRFRCAEALVKIAARHRAAIQTEAISQVLDLEISEKRLERAGERLLDREEDARQPSSGAPLRYVFALLGLIYPNA
ncbi:MAG TPA: Npt1/Npt2 family nucleotide transporter, partial [bacterium]|nr:Npt1/Npt2 family nucleotide transporter [bacterium]